MSSRASFARFRVVCWPCVVGVPGRRCFQAIWASALATVCVAGEPAAFPEFRPDAARDYLQAVVGQAQTRAAADAEAGFILARVRSQLGEKEEAERLARRALELDPNRPDILSFLAGLLIRQDRLDEAARLLRQTVALKPATPGSQRQLGMVLDRLGDREGARKAFEAGICEAPGDATAHLLLGRLLLDQDHAEAAAVHLEKACQLDPQLGGAFYALSQAQSRLGNAAAAEESLRTFQRLKAQEQTELDTSNATQDDAKVMRAMAASFHLEMAALSLKQRQPAQAEAHLRQAVRIAPEEPHGRELLGAFLLQTGRLPEARAVYQTLVQMRPTQVAYRLNLGTIELQLKDYPAAVEELKRALELDPRQPEVLGNLARFYLGARRDLPEALTLCRRLVEVRPTGASYDLLGWACYANGQISEARAAAKEAVQRDPQNAVYRERLQKLTQAP